MAESSAVEESAHTVITRGSTCLDNEAVMVALSVHAALRDFYFETQTPLDNLLIGRSSCYVC